MARGEPQLEGVLSKGYGIVPRLVMKDKSIDVGAKCLYAYLCSHTGNDNTCFPSRDTICNDLGINKNTFTKYKTQLEEAGYISVEKVCQNGRFLHNLYRISSVFPCPKFSDTEKPDMEKPDMKKVDTNNNNTNNNSINNNSINNNTPYNPPTGDYSPQGEPSSPKGKGKKKTEYVPPTLGEVIAYCASRGNKVDPQKFYDYYDAAGWVDGKGNPVRNWKQKCITWERSEGGDSRRELPRSSPDAQAPSPALSEAELDEMFGFSLDKT